MTSAPKNQYLHEVAITAIITKNGKYLIARRSPKKKRFGGMWTVPGGRLETKDYLALPKDTEHQWYNVLGRTLRREVEEEVGIKINNVEYLTSIAAIRGDGIPVLIISCTAEYSEGDVTLQEDELDEYKWVTLVEARKYNLIDGIYDELVMADNKLKGIKTTEWSRAH